MENGSTHCTTDISQSVTILSAFLYHIFVVKNGVIIPVEFSVSGFDWLHYLAGSSIPTFLENWYIDPEANLDLDSNYFYDIAIRDMFYTILRVLKVVNLK